MQFDNRVTRPMSHWFSRQSTRLKVYRPILILVLCALMGCGTTPAINGRDTKSELIVPGERVGKLLINTSTMPQILGNDSPEARARFASKGLSFEFEHGQKLKAVSIETDHFQLKNGLKVGSTIEEVETLMGKPQARKITGDKLDLDVLVYQGVMFLPKDGLVSVIRVSAKCD
jgi:hypothetical protein